MAATHFQIFEALTDLAGDSVTCPQSGRLSVFQVFDDGGLWHGQDLVGLPADVPLEQGQGVPRGGCPAIWWEAYGINSVPFGLHMFGLQSLHIYISNWINGL